MNAFILNLNDATALNDSVVARLIKLSEVCHPVVTEANTNCADVKIFNVVCCAVISVVAIIVGGFLLWKLIDHIANGVSAWYRRKWDVEDIERKQESDLLGKLLDYQKEISFPYDKNKDGVFEKKSYEKKEMRDYVRTLASLLKVQLPSNNNETEE